MKPGKPLAPVLPAHRLPSTRAGPFGASPRLDASGPEGTSRQARNLPLSGPFLALSRRCRLATQAWRRVSSAQRPWGCPLQRSFQSSSWTPFGLPAPLSLGNPDDPPARPRVRRPRGSPAAGLRGHASTDPPPPRHRAQRAPRGCSEATEPGPEAPLSSACAPGGKGNGASLRSGQRTRARVRRVTRRCASGRWPEVPPRLAAALRRASIPRDRGRVGQLRRVGPRNGTPRPGARSSARKAGSARTEACVGWLPATRMGLRADRRPAGMSACCPRRPLGGAAAPRSGVETSAWCGPPACPREGGSAGEPGPMPWAPRSQHRSPLRADPQDHFRFASRCDAAATAGPGSCEDDPSGPPGLSPRRAIACRHLQAGGKSETLAHPLERARRHRRVLAGSAPLTGPQGARQEAPARPATATNQLSPIRRTLDTGVRAQVWLVTLPSGLFAPRQGRTSLGVLPLQGLTNSPLPRISPRLPSRSWPYRAGRARNLRVSIGRVRSAHASPS